MGYFGRTMAAHGEEHNAHSELGNGLVAIGQANERIAGFQEVMAEQANSTWNDNLEQSAAMMKEYQVRMSPWIAVDHIAKSCRPLARSSRTGASRTTPAPPN